MTTHNRDKPADVIAVIKKNAKDEKFNREGKLFTLSLSDFKSVYFQIRSSKPDILLDVILNGNWALAQFSEMCNDRIRIRPDNFYNNLKKALSYRLYIDENDFDFASPFVNIFGQKKRLSFWDFMWEEVEANGLKAVIIFISLIFLLNFLVVKGNNTLLSTINQVIISISTIFFGIFILFTASQNLQTFTNSNLFSKGTSHRFMSVDKNVSRLSIFTIWVTAINLALSISPNILSIIIVNTSFFVITIRDLVLISTSFVITSMFVAMFTVEQYYFDRIRLIYETDKSKEMLDKRFDDLNQTNK